MAAVAEMELAVAEMERVRVWSKWKKGISGKRENVIRGKTIKNRRKFWEM